MMNSNKYCPRCKSVFECSVNRFQICQCTGTTLSGDERIFISKFYKDCLCIKCLKEMKEEYGESALNALSK